MTTQPLTKECRRCHRELPTSAFERNGKYVRNYCRQCRRETGRNAGVGTPKGVTHLPGYESLLGAILDLAAKDFQGVRQSATLDDMPSGKDGPQWAGFIAGPTEVLDCLMADDGLMVYFRATDTRLTPEEIRDTFMRVRLGVTLEAVK